MKNLAKVLLAACGMAVSFGAWPAQLMREGLWEISTRMEMPNMPQMPKGMPGMGETTMKHCYRKEDVRDDKKIVPQGQNDPNCAVKDTKVSGNKVIWEVQCKGGQGNSRGEMVYHSDSYEGVMKTTHPEMKGEMVMHYRGKRIGDCK